MLSLSLALLIPLLTGHAHTTSTNACPPLLATHSRNVPRGRQEFLSGFRGHSGNHRIVTVGSRAQRGNGRVERRRLFTTLGLVSGLMAGRTKMARAEDDYDTTTRDLIKSIRSTLEAEEEGKSLPEVRKVGVDAAKYSKEWISKFYGSSISRSKPSYESVAKALSELGNFYKQNGPQARLSKEVIDNIRERLDSADDAL
ncbi:hypothetical protein AAMO2058_000376100 [Amorphochlora amoebiformis]